MRWIFRSTAQGYEAKWWLEGTQACVVRFEIPENTVQAWRLAVRSQALVVEGQHVVASLSADEFIECKFYNPPDEPDSILERVAFCKFVIALMPEYPPHHDQAQLFGGDGFDVLSIIEQHSLAIADHWPYSWIFWHGRVREIGQNPLQDEVDSSRWEYALEKIYTKNSNTTDLADFLSHQDLLREIVHQITLNNHHNEHIVEQNYAALLMATVRFLETIRQPIAGRHSLPPSPTALRLFHQYHPRLCAWLVACRALPLNKRHNYLETIFAQRLSYNDEHSLLIDHLLPDLIDNVEAEGEASVTVGTIASLMAQHYLDQYSLDDAVAIWEKMSKVKPDRLLRALLSVYRRPWLYVAMTIVLLLLLFSLLVFSGEDYEIWALLPAALLLLLSISVTLYVLITITIRLVRRQGFSYLELFLPRLLGSIVVGLSIIALENTVWEITMNIPWANWALIVLASFGGALAYFFLDVHKSTRMLPTQMREEEQQRGRRCSVNSITRSVQTTFRVFAIGVLEALGLTTLISSLFPLQPITDTQPLLTWYWVEAGKVNGLFTIKIFGDQGLLLMYSPRLIVLWAGLALLIGAFAQLLWQDQQITAS